MNVVFIVRSFEILFVRTSVNTGTRNHYWYGIRWSLCDVMEFGSGFGCAALCCVWGCSRGGEGLGFLSLVDSGALCFCLWSLGSWAIFYRILLVGFLLRDI